MLKRFFQWLARFILSIDRQDPTVPAPQYYRESRKTVTAAELKRKAIKRRNIEKRK